MKLVQGKRDWQTDWWRWALTGLVITQYRAQGFIAGVVLATAFWWFCRLTGRVMFYVFG